MNKALIAKRLIDLRGNLTRDEVAKDLRISISALQMYENGQRVPKDEIKIRISNYYEVSVQTIFFENQEHEMCS
ncbi:helix-turn-helix transcriptional regulator [Gracilibacillus suaedae]|uniref:helix-turn-helix transcriptional regulator n=1 Tax=Gracilibacillus suaedae TaxID=2820273 RepID=UPI001ABE6ACF|nr:helix-turn-helix transcriptional regulator [Gracilibacillus suaedae]